MQLQGTTLQNNLAFVGGAIYLQKEAYMNGKSLVITKNTAYKEAGAIFVAQLSYLNIYGSQINQNQAYETSAIKIFGGSDYYNSTIEQSLFYNNYANNSYTLSVDSGQLFISKTNFRLNNAQRRTKNIFIIFSKLVLVQCRFWNDNHIYNIQDTRLNNFTGGFVLVGTSSHLTIIESYFKNGEAYQGGAIYLSSESYLTIINSEFNNNYARSQGGAIYSQASFDIIISDRTIFIDNQALGQGDHIYMIDAFAHGLKYGGALYFKMIDSNKLPNKTYPSMPRINITLTNFTLCQAFQGGAIYDDNIDFLLIQNSSFIENSALYHQNFSSSGIGAGIFYQCEIDIQFQQCKIILNKSNSFKDNFAYLQGGAIHWNVVEIEFDRNLTVFQNNTALLYGDDISAVPQQIVYLSEEQYREYQQIIENVQYKYWKIISKPLNRRILQEIQLVSQKSLENYKSGAMIPKSYFAVADMYGRVVTSNNNSNILLTVNDEYKNDSGKIKYYPILEGQTSFQALNGAYEVQNVYFTGAPGFNYKIDLTTDAIDYRIPSNKLYLEQIKQKGKEKISFELDMMLRYCQPGESFSSAGKCQNCEDGISFSLVQMFEPGECIKCPNDVAICLGGNQVGPKPGIWRKTNSTDRFFECFYRDACLGMLPPLNNPLGVCAQGYQGLLCSDCKVGFSRTSFQGMLIFMIRSTLNSAREEKNVTSIYLKILVNHLQLISLIQSFKFDFPDELTNFFSGTGDVKDSTSTQILSLDCFLDNRINNNDQMNPQLFFQKLIIIAVIPFLIVFIVLIIWTILKIYYQKKKINLLGKQFKDKISQLKQIMKKGDQQVQEVALIQLKKLMRDATYEVSGKIITTVIILLFFMHPTIVEFTVSNFNCYNIEEERRVKVDLTIKCWEGNHSFFSYTVALPSLFGWGIGIPFFALIMIIKNKDTLMTIATKEKLGFLYNGYILFVIILIANAVFFVVWALKMQVEVKNVLIKKFPKIYIFLFMCNNSEKFKDQQSKARAKEINELLIEEYERKKLQYYLGEDRVLEAINYKKFGLIDEKGYQRALREKDNKIILNEVMQKDAKIHGVTDFGIFRNYGDNQQLDVDDGFMKGEISNDDLSSHNNSSITLQLILLGRINISTSYNEFTESNIFEEEKQSEGLNFKFKQQRKNSTFYNQKKTKIDDDNQSLSHNLEIRDNDNMHKPQWEQDYIRKKKGILKDEEVFHELWGKDQKTENKGQLKKKELIEKYEQKRKLMNNFMIPMDVNFNQINQIKDMAEKISDDTNIINDDKLLTFQIKQKFEQAQNEVQIQKKKESVIIKINNRKFMRKQELEQELALELRNKKKKINGIKHNDTQMELQQKNDAEADLNEEQIFRDLERDQILYEESESNLTESQAQLTSQRIEDYDDIFSADNDSNLSEFYDQQNEFQNQNK
ncbi:UNKNOWN [Stylonychia lemnae]|uniref:Pectin lyase fold/virulence factor n=1 Tax=Stylonychia lemnae TaxID=5949 RepID=A0A078B610_STYLE|nr:UNKNOWN [Stylonychia lemnae]|eukprot:CDW88933.1 UNKNOWN [Stylonychia lemnae]